MTLQWRRKILLGAKISSIRLNKDDNLPEYYDECLLQPMFVPKHFSFVKREKIVYKMLLYRHQDFSFYISSSHAVKILFLTFTCEDLGVAMVTNMISQLQELSAQARGRFFWNFIHKMASRCKDGTVTGDFLDELPNFHIDTFSEREEHSGRFAEVRKWKKLSSM